VKHFRNTSKVLENAESSMNAGSTAKVGRNFGSRMGEIRF
jgi:hypothetical protein